MKKATIIVAVLGWALTNVGFAAYTVDGSLSDWGVTPFVDWVPNGSAVYTQTDNVNLYNAAGYLEKYDFEAMYFDSDSTNLYLAVVSSFPLGTGTGIGDIGIDLNGDMTVSPHGVVTGLEYALLVGSVGLGQVLHDPVWSPTTAEEWPDGWQGSPYRASGGTLVGSATVPIQDYPAMEFGTYILEAAIPRSILPDFFAGDPVGLHMSDWCGNDSINLIGTVTGPGHPVPPVPAPGALVLGSLGVGLVGWLRRKGQLGSQGRK